MFRDFVKYRKSHIKIYQTTTSFYSKTDLKLIKNRFFLVKKCEIQVIVFIMNMLTRSSDGVFHSMRNTDIDILFLDRRLTKIWPLAFEIGFPLTGSLAFMSPSGRYGEWSWDKLDSPYLLLGHSISAWFYQGFYFSMVYVNMGKAEGYNVRDRGRGIQHLPNHTLTAVAWRLALRLMDWEYLLQFARIAVPLSCTSSLVLLD